jgi:hypothetical protein
MTPRVPHGALAGTRTPASVNEKYPEKRAATWISQYCTGKLPPGQPDLEPWETELY